MSLLPVRSSVDDDSDDPRSDGGHGTRTDSGARRAASSSSGDGEAPTDDEPRTAVDGGNSARATDDGPMATVREEVDPVVNVARRVVERGRDEQVGFLAAAIAHYAFVSLVPLLLVVLAVGTWAGGEELARALVERVGTFLSPSGQDLFRSALTSPSGRGPAGVVGLVGLLWATLKVFRGLDIAFSRLYGTAGEKGLPGQLWNGLIVLVSVGFGVVAVSVASATVALVGTGLLQALPPLTLAATLVVVLFPLYYVFPDTSMSARDALPGAVLAAGGWTVLATAFGVYTSVAGSFALYGVLGAVLLLVTWLYLGALVVLLGALLNIALDETAPVRTGSYKSQGADGSSE